MEINELANKLVEYCRKGDWETAQKELYADHIISLEPEGAPNQRTEGLENIIKKGEDFDKMVEKVHSIEVSDPLVAERFITFTMTIDCDFIGMGRTLMPEVCVYEVQDNKIVKEQFFYTPQPQA